MSKITIAPNAAGAATFTIAAPATATNRTLTLPDQTATLATTDDVAAAGGMTVLGTLTMSGASQSLTGQVLTGYKQLLFDFNGVSHNNGTNTSISIGSAAVLSGATASDAAYGTVWVSLFSGIATPTLSRNTPLPAAVSGNGQVSQTGYSNATTTITVSVAAGAFDAGSVRVYGVK